MNTSYSKNIELPKKNILGVGVTDASKENILEYIVKNCQKSTKPYYIVTPNPEIIVLAAKNTRFKKALTGAKLALHDGVGIGLAAKILGMSLHQRLTGLELVEMLCQAVSDWPITVGFLGGGPKVAEKTAECLTRKYPGLRVVFVGQEWSDRGFDLAGEYKGVSIQYKGNNQKSLNTLYSSLNTRIDVLFVAFGAPKQEFWMADNVGKIPVTVMVGVGGAFDQIANPSLRPPQFLQTSGFGWLYRLIRQPWRIKRQLALLEFAWMTVREKF